MRLARTFVLSRGVSSRRCSYLKQKEARRMLSEYGLSSEEPPKTPLDNPGVLAGMARAPCRPFSQHKCKCLKAARSNTAH